jgi:hypothetical protein
MLLTLLSIFSADADACSPGLAQVYDVVPSEQTESVPVDTIIKIELGGGYLQGHQEIILRQGETQLLVDVESHIRTIDLIEEHIVLEVTPLDELEPNLEYTVESVNPDGELKTLSTFYTNERRSEAVLVTPTIHWVEHNFHAITEEEMNSCNYSNSTDVFIDFGNGEDLATYSINLYRVDRYSENLTADDLPDRFHTVLQNAQYTTLDAKITETTFEEEYCFVARYSNEAGQEGPLSDVVCSLDYAAMEWECGTRGFGLPGCSSMGLGTSGLFTMLMSLFGLVLRRRE